MKKKRENHLEGLKDLDRAGITLEAMTKESWLDVLVNEELFFDMVLKLIFDLDPREVVKRDVATREKLAKLLRSDSEVEGIVDKMKRVNVNAIEPDESTVNGEETKEDFGI